MQTTRKVIHEDPIVVETPLERSKRTQASSSSAQTGEEEVQDTRPVILYLITRSDWDDPQKNIYALAEYFAPDYQVQVVYGAHEYTGNHIFKERLSELEVVQHPLRWLVKGAIIIYDAKAFWEIMRLIHRLDPAVIHSYDAKTTIFVGISRMLLHFQSRVVASIYNLSSNHNSPNIIERFVRWMRTRAFRMADEIVVSDEYLQSQAVERFEEERVHLIRPGIMELDFVDPARKRQALAQDASGSLREKIADSQTILLGNIAPLEPEHNPGYILQALATLKEQGHQFVYIHYGDGSQRHLIKHEIEQFDLSDCVFLAGRDSYAERYLPVFDLLVHPSSADGMPTLVQSAGLARRALVLSPTPGLANAVVNDKEAAMVPARDADALADKLSYLIEHPERRRSMGVALEQRVRADYQPIVMRHRHRELYGVE